MLSNQYPVHHGGQIIGDLNIVREGLYYVYHGEFHLKSTDIYRVFAITASEKINMGVCRPYQGLWHLKGRISVKNIDIQKVRFEINPACCIEHTIPLNANEAFPYLQYLDECKYEAKNGDSILIVAEKS